MSKKYRLSIVIVSILLIISIGFNVYFVFFNNNNRSVWCSYLQNPSEIYSIESGIIEANMEFRDGEDLVFEYDFDNPEYEELLAKYDIKNTAGNGSEFEKAKNLMHEYAGRLVHKSSIDLKPEQMNALYLLDYSLDNKSNGIFCRAKAQILNEMCLALKIYSRKVWLMPNSVYDNECHVVNEVWDTQYKKWIMLDITSDTYWVDENKTPLSILEIREKLGKQEFCTPVKADDDLSDLNSLLDKHYGQFIYIAKNMVYFGYMDKYTVGESTVYHLMPVNQNKNYDFLISKECVEAPPVY